MKNSQPFLNVITYYGQRKQGDFKKPSGLIRRWKDKLKQTSWKILHFCVERFVKQNFFDVSAI